MKSQTLIVTFLIASMVLTPGCSKKYVAKVAPFERGRDDVVVKSAPRSGMYHVQFVDDERYIKNAGVMPAVYLRKGERVGFREDEAGKLTCIAGEREIEVVGAPASATHVMWYHKSRKPSQFAKNLRGLGEALEIVAITTAAVAGVVTLGAAWLYVESEDDDDCPSYLRNQKAR